MNEMLALCKFSFGRKGAKDAKNAKKRKSFLTLRPSRPLRLCVQISLTQVPTS